jgi:sugar lactone lactonase YvrE
MRKTAIAVASFFAPLLLVASSASAAPSISGRFPLESETNTNSKIVEGPDGNIWLPARNGVTETDIARVTPEGKVAEYKLPGIEFASGIAVGPEKKIWITATNKVASFSPSDPEGTVQVFNDAFVGSNDPIVAGPDGDMWDATSENVIRFSPSEPEKPEEFFVKELSPRDIEVDGQLLVIADAGLPRIVEMSASGTVVKEVTIGHKGPLQQEGASQGVAVAPDGTIGFSQPGAPPEQVGFINPAGTAQAFERNGDPFGAAYGSDHAFWFALKGPPSGVERLTTSGELTFLGGVPGELSPRQITSGPGNTMWFTIEEPGKPSEVGRVSGLEPPVEPVKKAKETAPDTTILKGPKGKVKAKGKSAKVKFTFSSTPAGAKFECALVKLPNGKGKAPKPKFKGCKSPKKLKLKPGKYRFSVRAVSAGGLVDATPATRAFRVVHVG